MARVCAADLSLYFVPNFSFPSAIPQSLCVLCLLRGHSGISPCYHVLLNLSFPYGVSPAGEGFSILTAGRGVALMRVFTLSSSSVQVEALSSKAPTAGQIPSALLPMINFTSGNQAEFSSEQLNILLSHTHAYTY